jgi:type VI secretion system protein ImpH
LAGLGMDNPDMAQMVGMRKLLAMLGLANQRTRTAEGLAGVLRHAVPDAQITVEECYPVWSSAQSYEQNALGDSCLLGRGFYDRANAVRVVIKPQTRESVLGLTPGQANHCELMTLLRFYLGYEVEAYLEMHVAPDLMPAPVLNSNQATLGYTTQLPPPRTSDLTTITRVQLAVWTGGSKGNTRPCSVHERNANEN